MTTKFPLWALALLLAVIALATTPSANAAAINWGAATTISADTDIFNLGSLNYAYNQSNAATTVNGVLFAAGGNATSLGGGNVTMSGFNGGVYTGYSNPTGLSANYSILTNSATYVNSPSSTTVNLNNLAASHVYATQIWVNDSRTGALTRNETVTGGGNTVTLSYTNSNSAGGAGQYAIGGFTANATTQAFTMLGNTSTQLNAIQVRDVTGVWSGAGGGSWADASASFTANNTWSTVSTLIGGSGTVTFADTDGFKTAVTNSTISVQSGGVSAGTVIFQNSSVAYTISNASGTTGITGATALVKTGTGTLTLSSANTYTGGTSLNGGTIQIGDASALGTSGTLSFGGGTLLYGTGITTDLSARFSNAASQNYRIDTNGNNVTLATALTSSGGNFTKSGAGNLTLTGVNTYTGGTTINGGTLIFQNTNGSAVAPVTGAIINNANLVYALTASSSGTYSLNVPNGSGISGSGNLSMSIATQSGQQGYLQFPTGNVTQGGSLTFSQTGTTGYLNGFALVSTANATSTLKGASITMSGEIGVGSSGNLGYLSLDTSATNGSINLDVSLGVNSHWYVPQGLTANAGTGTINVTGTTYGNNGWTTSGGTGNSLTGGLQISAANFTTNDKLALHATAASSVTGNVTLAGTSNTITVDNGVTMSVSGQFKGSGAGFTKNGTGTMTLSGTNTYTGATSVTEGTLQFAKTVSLYNNAPASWTAANVKIAAGGVLALNVGGTNEFSTGNVTTLLANLGGANGTGTTGFAAGSFIAFDTTNASGGNFTVADTVANSTGSGGGVIGLKKLGSGTLALTGGNTYTGATTVNAGTLFVGPSSSLGNNSTTSVNGGTLAVDAGAAGRTLNNGLVLNGGTVLGGFQSNIGSGGTIMISGGNVTHTFNATGTSASSYTLTLLSTTGVNGVVVGGGGGAGGQTSSTSWLAGGAGGQVTSFTNASMSGSYNITVGGGGAYNKTNNTAGFQGGNSSIGTYAAGGQYSATGGYGGGGNGTYVAGQGGTSPGNIINGVLQSGSPYAGGVRNGTTKSGGGAGAGQVGADGSTGNGGNGTTVAGFGSFGGGGNGAGGTGVAGTGATAYGGGTQGNGTDGTGGGGGALPQNAAGGNGGSGIVIVQYAFNPYAASSTLSLSGGVNLQSTSTLDACSSGGLIDITTNAISGNGGVNIASSISSGGVVRYSVAATYAGDTTINSGAILRMNTTNALANGTGKGNISANGTLDLNGQSTTTINGLSGSGFVDNSSGSGTYTLSVGGNDQTSTFGGVIKNTSGSVALTKNGAGNLTLSGINSYSGNTTVSNGNLTVSGAGRLANTGNVIITTGGSLLVTSSNAINTAANVTMNGGTLKMGVSTAGGNQTFGALTMSSNSTLDFADASGNTVWFGGFVGSYAADKILTISHWDLNFDHLYFTTTQATNLGSFKFGLLDAKQLQISTNQFEIIAVPEPGTILAGVLLLGGLAIAERRRLKRLLSAGGK